MSFSIKKTKHTPTYSVQQNPPPEINLTDETDGSSHKNIPAKINTSSSSSGRYHSIRTSKAKMTEDEL
jgi:hypothetical protein